MQTGAAGKVQCVTAHSPRTTLGALLSPWLRHEPLRHSSPASEPALWLHFGGCLPKRGHLQPWGVCRPGH